MWERFHWLIGIWVRDLTVPMHLDLNWRTLCAPYQFKGALFLCWSSRWPPDLYWVQKEGAQICMSKWSQSFIHRECGLRFHPLLHISCTTDCQTAPLGEDVFSGPVTTLDSFLLQDRNLALVPRQGPEISSRACLGVTKNSPPYPMLVNQPASNPSSYILPRDSKGRLRSKNL